MTVTSKCHVHLCALHTKKQEHILKFSTEAAELSLKAVQSSPLEPVPCPNQGSLGVKIMESTRRKMAFYVVSLFI